MSTDRMRAPYAAAWRDRLDTALLVAALFALWQLLHLFVGGDALPSPMAAARRLQRLVADADFGANAFETGRAFGYALLISWLGGLGLGVLLGLGAARRGSGEGTLHKALCLHLPALLRRGGRGGATAMVAPVLNIHGSTALKSACS